MKGQTMDEANIRKYALLMKELELTGLEIRENDRVVRLERTLAAAPVVTAVQTLPEKVEKPSVGEVTVTSPMVGVFYTAPAENSEPFVKVGDRVRKGDTLCIIEAMKLMNEITADQDGEIAEICAVNGQVVEYGSELFRLKR